MSLSYTGGLTILNGYRPTYVLVTASNLTLTSNAYGTHYNITNSAFAAITYPNITNAYSGIESNAYFVFRNNTGTYLSVANTFVGISGPSTMTIPPANSVTVLAGAGTSWVLF
jgi:hypothetical protein